MSGNGATRSASGHHNGVPVLRGSSEESEAVRSRPGTATLDDPGASGSAAGDWHALLNAVTERLRSATSAPDAPGEAVTLRSPLSPPPTSTSTLAPHPLRTAALDCVMLLEQLQHRLDSESRQLEQRAGQAGHLRDALNRLRLELTGAQAGERHARHLALHDGLTALPNRVHFRQRLDQALALRQRASRPLGLLYLDLDGFKPVNDAYGHGAGDELLRIVAARLRHALRANDLVGRIGGDEFACLLGDVTDRPQLGQIARKLLDAVAAPLKIGQVQVSVAASIGIALYPGDGVSADDLLRNADAAMFRAKRQRVGYAFFGQPAGP